MPDRPHFKHPLELTASGALATWEQDSDGQIGDAIDVILSYDVGTRRGLPAFGIPEEAYFEAGGPDLDLVRAAVLTFEPEASVAVELSDARLEEGLARVRLGYSTDVGTPP